MIYKCIKCNEPVSDELPDNTIEAGAIIACRQCLFNWLVSPVFFDLTDYAQLNMVMDNELRAQFVEVKND